MQLENWWKNWYLRTGHKMLWCWSNIGNIDVQIFWFEVTYDKDKASNDNWTIKYPKHKDFNSECFCTINMKTRFCGKCWISLPSQPRILLDVIFDRTRYPLIDVVIRFDIRTDWLFPSQVCIKVRLQANHDPIPLGTLLSWASSLFQICSTYSKLRKINPVGLRPLMQLFLHMQQF